MTDPLSSPPLRDPGLLRALAHPARLSITSYLNTGTAATATELAEVVGLSPSATSYHLRALARAGLIEEAPSRGDGRERVWTSALRSYSVATDQHTEPEVRAAEDQLIDAYLVLEEERVRQFLARRDEEPPERYAAAVAADTLLIPAAAPPTVLAPLTGRLADRMDSRRLMVVVSLIEAAVCALLAFVSAVPLMIGLVVVLGCGLAIPTPALNALVPDMVSRERLPKAAAIGPTASSVGMLLAPALGGLLVGPVRRQLGDGGFAVALLATLGGACAAVLAAAAVPGVGWLAPLWIVGGLCNGGTNVSAGVLLGRRVPPDVRGRAFALFSGAANGANALGYLIAGLALAAVSARTMIALAGGVGLVAALALRGTDVAGPTPPPPPARRPGNARSRAG